MSIEMLGDQVLIAAVKKEEKTAGGIILSADVKKNASEPGVVLSVGPATSAAHLTTGDKVFLDWNESLPVEIEGQQAVIISSEHIKAILS
jgi:co-chaperonin GroES (HSP10)